MWRLTPLAGHFRGAGHTTTHRHRPARVLAATQPYRLAEALRTWCARAGVPLHRVETGSDLVETLVIGKSMAESEGQVSAVQGHYTRDDIAQRVLAAARAAAGPG